MSNEDIKQAVLISMATLFIVVALTTIADHYLDEPEHSYVSQPQ